jgi:hypothetical protein
LAIPIPIPIRMLRSSEVEDRNTLYEQGGGKRDAPSWIYPCQLDHSPAIGRASRHALYLVMVCAFQGILAAPTQVNTALE